MQNVFDKEKFFLAENFVDEEKSFLVENFFDEGKMSKNFLTKKKSLLVGKPWFMENFLDQEKTLTLWKTFLIKENFGDRGKVIGLNLLENKC